MFIDARIPVRFHDPASGEAAPGPRADEALVLSGDAAAGEASAAAQGWAAVSRLPAGASPAAGHAQGCVCCAVRSPQAAVLTRLFQARARGEVGFFRALVAILPEQAAAELRDALVSDPFLSGCFVQAGPAICQQHFTETGAISK